MSANLNKKCRVGLLGATGLVGKGALKLFMYHCKEYQICIAGRSIERMKNAVCEISPEKENQIEYSIVDITNLEQSESFIKTCDIIINCAGPVSLIGDSIERLCIKNKVSLFDASADDVLQEKMVVLHDRAVENQVTCVIAAGINPGLTEMIPYYIMTNRFDFTRELNVFLAGTGKLSYNASYDIIQTVGRCSLNTANGRKMFIYIHNGKKEKSKQFIRKKEYKEPVGQKATYPFISSDFYNMVNKCNAECVYYYDSYLMPLINNRYILDIDTEDKKREAARKMSEASACDTEYGIILAEGSGEKCGKSVEIRYEMNFDGSGENLTGMVVAAAGLSMLINGTEKYGCFYAYEAIKFSDILPFLNEIDSFKITETEVNV